MKKIYLLGSIALFSITAASAQTTYVVPAAGNPHASHAVPSNARKTFLTGPSRDVKTGFVDYASLASDNGGYVWPFNNNYVNADTVGGNYSNFAFAGVAINPFDVYTDGSSQEAILGSEITYATYPAGFSFTIDSIFVSMTHENNSGLTDYYGVRVVPLNATGGFNLVNTALWEQKDSVTDANLSPGGNWVGTNARFLYSTAPAYTTTPGQKVGIVFFYNGPKEDTCGISALYYADPLGSPDEPSQTTPHASSWIVLTYLNGGAPIATNNITSTGLDGVSHPFAAQDLQILAQVTFNDVTGISDNEMNKTVTLYQNMPNPVDAGSTIIKYDLVQAATVDFAFYDVTGKKVKEVNEGQMPTGNYQLEVNTSDLSKGVYFYTLKTSTGALLTKKMVVTK